MFFSAADGFDWETAQYVVQLVGGESRLRALGLIDGRLHMLVCTLRETSVRIISLRKAKTREVRQYANA